MIFFTKNLNKNFFGGRGGGDRVSEFFFVGGGNRVSDFVYKESKT